MILVNVIYHCAEGEREGFIGDIKKERIGEIIEEEYPGVYVTLSSKLAPEFREFLPPAPIKSAMIILLFHIRLTVHISMKSRPRRDLSLILLFPFL